MRTGFKSRASTIAALIFLTLIATTAFAERMTGPWRLTGFTKYRDGLFADTSRISHSSPETVTIWVRIGPSAKSKYRQSINDYLGSINRGGRGFKFIEIQCEFHCTVDRLRFLRFVYLDQAGRTIHTADESRPSWFYIPPGNLWGNVEKLACGRQ